MSAALKIAVILAVAIALASSETTASKDKEKRGSDKEVAVSNVYQQQQQQQHQVLPQQTFQYVYPQTTQQRLTAVASHPYTQQQLQYLYRQAPQQKQVAAVTSQYTQPQLQYIYPQGAAAQRAVVGSQYVQPHSALAQTYLGGQYYVHPGQGSLFGAQYGAHPGAPFFLASQHPAAQQYYVPQGHQAYYLGGHPADYRALLANHQQYPVQGVQQLLAYSAKAPSGVEPRGGDGVAYVLPFGGAAVHQIPQTYAQPSSEGLPILEGHVSPAAQAQETPALNAAVSNGKYSSKTSSERHQG